jgi:hypothetical protein
MNDLQAWMNSYMEIGEERSWLGGKITAIVGKVAACCKNRFRGVITQFHALGDDKMIRTEPK